MPTSLMAGTPIDIRRCAYTTLTSGCSSADFVRSPLCAHIESLSQNTTPPQLFLDVFLAAAHHDHAKFFLYQGKCPLLSSRVRLIITLLLRISDAQGFRKWPTAKKLYYELRRTGPPACWSLSDNLAMSVPVHPGATLTQLHRLPIGEVDRLDGNMAFFFPA
jgi:hypothetical protein